MAHEDPQRSDRPASGSGHGAVRYSRRWFLVLAASFIAGVAGVIQLFRWLTGSGGSAGGASGAARASGANFPVLAVEATPQVPPAEWVVVVDGLVEEPQRLDHQTWAALPHVAETADFHCVEGWSVDDVRWGGVAPAMLLERARVKPEGRFVTFHARGGTYSDSLSLEQALAPATLLADALGDKPLPADHGGPVRLVVPDQLGYKSVKWVTRLEVTDKPAQGYWEQRGYARDAPV